MSARADDPVVTAYRAYRAAEEAAGRVPLTFTEWHRAFSKQVPTHPTCNFCHQ